MEHPLAHKTIWEDKTRTAISLPFIENLRQYHTDGSFHLVEDPNVKKKAAIVGMFVLRPAISNWIDPILDKKGDPSSMYKVENGWSYNFNGLDGGWLLANGSPLDAYRLALQYGVSDAVIVGSNTVSAEGCDPLDLDEQPNHRRGYLWQPYGPCEWPHLAAADTDLVAKIADQRLEWQRLGYLSSRKYPAQILVTWSGERYDGARDFLEARCLRELHPNGEPIEVYIVTSDAGAEKIRQRAHLHGLQDRIDEILLPMSPPGSPTEIDLPRFPYIFFERFGMKILNHDGGQLVLRKFCAAGILSQMNLTLCRKLSLMNVIETLSAPVLAADVKADAVANFVSRSRSFFSTAPSDTSVAEGIPECMRPVAIIADTAEDVAVVTFDSTAGFDF